MACTHGRVGGWGAEVPCTGAMRAHTWFVGASSTNGTRARSTSVIRSVRVTSVLKMLRSAPLASAPSSEVAPPGDAAAAGAALLATGGAAAAASSSAASSSSLMAAVLPHAVLLPRWGQCSCAAGRFDNLVGWLCAFSRRICIRRPGRGSAQPAVTLAPRSRPARTLSRSRFQCS